MRERRGVWSPPSPEFRGGRDRPIAPAPVCAASRHQKAPHFQASGEILRSCAPCRICNSVVDATHLSQIEPIWQLLTVTMRPGNGLLTPILTEIPIGKEVKKFPP